MKNMMPHSPESILFILFNAAFFIFLNASGLDTNSAKDILFKAREQTLKTNIKHTSEKKLEGNLVRRDVYYRGINDQETFERSEFWLNNHLQEVSFKRPDGIFLYDPDKQLVLKNDLKNPRLNPVLDWDYMFRVLDWNEGCTYSAADTSIRGVPCWKITMESPKDEEAKAKMLNRTVEYMQENKELMESRFLARRLFWIDKRNGFIYACEFYNAAGQKVYAKNWFGVEFLREYDKKLFEFPAEARQVEAKNEKDLKKIYTKYMMSSKSTGPGFHFIEFFFNKIEPYATTILFWLGIGCVAAVAVIKIRRKRSN